MKKYSLFILALILSAFPVSAQDAAPVLSQASLRDSATALVSPLLKSLNFFNGTKIDSVRISGESGEFELFFNEHFSHLPFRPEMLRQLNDSLASRLRSLTNGAKIRVYSLGVSAEQLIPNAYRSSDIPEDRSRVPAYDENRQPQVVRNISKPYTAQKGLQNRNIVLWPSHGWYYSQKAGRWEWQRPRLFQIVEDFVPYSFVIPYLLPMLENAGANVYVPRERDIQINEAVVDNDSPEDIRVRSYREMPDTNSFYTMKEPGFLFRETYKENENPFLLGRSRGFKSDEKGTRSIEWVPEIPESGEYAVYISYTPSPDNVRDAHYTLTHEGGQTEFLVNQQIGGNSWYYLGTFSFLRGRNPQNCMLRLSSKSGEPGKQITADAVRFGGGMGKIERAGSVSGRPKFAEAARYWLQYAGMPDTLVWLLNENDDYKDDYQSRNEYANYLRGAPYGPTKARDRGLGVPVDLSLAFHTDAGITANDTVIGTLSIYNIKGTDGKTVFGDEVSRFANRDFADILQSQICDDIRASFDPAWSRRQLRNAEYAESTRPNVPSALLELLSHQNMLDMKYFHDPQFRFTVARSIYKSMLKYLNGSAGKQYIVQPLPVSHLAAILQPDGSVELSWQPVEDKLAPGSAPLKYIVYRKINDGGFDNGTVFEKTSAIFKDIKPLNVYSFRVAALNEGGESMPSETVSVGRTLKEEKQVLVINGFHRVSAPAWVESPGFSGFLNFLDEGVPHNYDIGFTGAQWDFNPASPFLTNDAPGHGASGAEDETAVFAGNTFNYPAVHGRAILSAGYSFSSCSENAVIDGNVKLTSYACIDLIYGEQKETPWQKKAFDTLWGTRFRTFPSGLVSALQAYLEADGALLVSGSYIASDVFLRKPADSTLIKFVEKYLHYSYGSSHATKTGNLAAGGGAIPVKYPLAFNTAFNREQYRVEAPDALQPLKEASVILRYPENSFPAGIAWRKRSAVVALGFPFETVLTEKERGMFMKSMLGYLMAPR